MDKLTVGTVVLVRFPYADFSRFKKRPALIVAKAEFNNLILCQITSKPYSSRKTIKISPADFAKGALPVTSHVRPDKLFTVEQSVIVGVVGQLSQPVISATLADIRELFLIPN